MGVVLTVVDGPRKGLEFRTGERTSITIGRSKASDFRIRDASMSRVHAVVAQDTRGWYVEDCKSSNGVWVDDVRVAGSQLSEDSMFRLGDETVVQFRHLAEDELARTGVVEIVPQCVRCREPVAENVLVRGSEGRPFHFACRDLNHLIGKLEVQVEPQQLRDRLRRKQGVDLLGDAPAFEDANIGFVEIVITQWT